MATVFARPRFLRATGIEYCPVEAFGAFRARTRKKSVFVVMNFDHISLDTKGKKELFFDFDARLLIYVVGKIPEQSQFKQKHHLSLK